MGGPRERAAASRGSESPAPGDAPEATSDAGAAAAAGGGGIQVNIVVNVYLAARPDGGAGGIPCPGGAYAPAEPEEERPPAQGDWAYAVWHLPGRPEWRGVHAGGLSAWRALESAFKGGRYEGSGSRLRRFESEQLAEEAYAAEAAQHRAPLPARIFRHPLL